MTLQSLPPELLLHVGTFLDPISTLRFALTCKQYHKLYKTILSEHGRLLSEYKTIDTTATTFPPKGRDVHLLWNVLKEILEDPRKGWYIREISLPYNRYCHWDIAGYQSGVQVQVPPEQDQAMFIKAARALEDLYPTQLNGTDTVHDLDSSRAGLIAQLESRISAGYDDAIVAILIHHLPCLQTIRITDSEVDCLELMLRWVAATYNDSARACHLPLQRLRKASVAHWDTEMGCNPDWACYFLSIPSLQGFAIATTAGEPSEEAMQAYQPESTSPKSNVKDLLFDRCVFSTEGLESVLRGVKNLKTLTYTDGGATVSDGESYESKRIISAIGRTVGHSLEHLVLNQSDFGDKEMTIEVDARHVSFEGFEKLKILGCEWHMLQPGDVESDMEADEPLESGFFNSQNYDDPADIDVRDLLPASLQELQLLANIEDLEWDQAVDSLRTPNPRTPELGKIRVERRHMYGWSDQVEDVFGNYPRPLDEDNAHPLAKLLEGHGY